MASASSQDPRNHGPRFSVRTARYPFPPRYILEGTRIREELLSVILLVVVVALHVDTLFTRCIFITRAFATVGGRREWIMK